MDVWLGLAARLTRAEHQIRFRINDLKNFHGFHESLTLKMVFCGCFIRFYTTCFPKKRGNIIPTPCSCTKKLRIPLDPSDNNHSKNKIIHQSSLQTRNHWISESLPKTINPKILYWLVLKPHLVATLCSSFSRESGHQLKSIAHECSSPSAQPSVVPFPETNILPLKIGRAPKGNESSNHPLSGANS